MPEAHFYISDVWLDFSKRAWSVFPAALVLEQSMDYMFLSSEPLEVVEVRVHLVLTKCDALK